MAAGQGCARRRGLRLLVRGLVRASRGNSLLGAGATSPPRPFRVQQPSAHPCGPPAPPAPANLAALPPPHPVASARQPLGRNSVLGFSSPIAQPLSAPPALACAQLIERTAECNIFLGFQAQDFSQIFPSGWQPRQPVASALLDGSRGETAGTAGWRGGGAIEPEGGRSTPCACAVGRWAARRLPQAGPAPAPIQPPPPPKTARQTVNTATAKAAGWLGCGRAGWSGAGATEGGGKGFAGLRRGGMGCRGEGWRM